MDGPPIVDDNAQVPNSLAMYALGTSKHAQDDQETSLPKENQ